MPFSYRDRRVVEVSHGRSETRVLCTCSHRGRMPVCVYTHAHVHAGVCAHKHTCTRCVHRAPTEADRERACSRAFESHHIIVLSSTLPRRRYRLIGDAEHVREHCTVNTLVSDHKRGVTRRCIGATVQCLHSIREQLNQLTLFQTCP